MTEKEKESATFHNEDAVFRIAMWSNIVAWVTLILSLLSFGNIAVKIITDASKIFAPAGVPDALFNNANLVLGQLLTPLTGGVFVFLVLRGLSQALYLAMDFYLDDEVDND